MFVSIPFIHPIGYPDRLVVQFDADLNDSTQFAQSQVVIDSSYISTSFFQLGPNDQLYFSRNGVDSLGTINFPNLPSPGCNFQLNVVSLNGNIGYGELPQFLQRYKTYFHHTGDCLRDTVNFTSDIWPPPDSIRWNFGDPSSGAANTSMLANPSHSFTSSGSHLVELYVRHNDNRRDTTCKPSQSCLRPNPPLAPTRLYAPRKRRLLMPVHVPVAPTNGMT